MGEAKDYPKNLILFLNFKFFKNIIFLTLIKKYKLIFLKIIKIIFILINYNFKLLSLFFKF